ncbi:MAG: CYTH and CHAD domain-containing protein [Aestuariivirga sp.]|nr:CYTH and CHAD domain-containing protein [Aestuariivirga sp.]
MSGSAAGQNQEIEIKFGTDAAGLARLLDAPLIKTANDLQTENLKATYFDTPSNALRKKGVILRIRKSGDDVPVLGMKAPGAAGDGPFHRKEIEVNSPSLKPNLALFDKTTEKFLWRIIGDQPLAAKFKMEFKRQSGLITSGSSVVEIAVDQGQISSGKQRVPLAEVELELVSGNKADLIDLAMRLAEDFSLRLDFVSKAEKSFRTLLEEKPAPVKAAPIKSKALATFDDAVTAIISNTLAHFVANWACLRESDEPESIHQMRIALRRMRCALSIFNRASPNAGFGALRDNAGHLASAFGPVRNADAIRLSLLGGPLASTDCPETSGALRAILEKRRVAAYAVARSELESLAATAFVLKVHSFLARRDWREAPANGNSRKSKTPTRKFFKAELSRLRACVIKREKAAAVSDQARHKLRIALKNLRYGVDFFDLFGNGKRRQAYKKRMSALQDLLGVRNDIVVARIYLKELRDEAGPEAERTMEFIRGWYAREAAVADRAIGKSWKKFRRTGIFWN